MDSDQNLRSPVNLDKEKTDRLYSLCVLSSALKETCLKRNNITYASGSGGGEDESLGVFEKFLCKLAYVCDTQKGGKTMSALVCLKGENGPQYLLSSNWRNEPQLKEVTSNLSDLLEYASENPDRVEEKALHKRILWRILELNFERVCEYIRILCEHLKKCIEDCQNHEETKSPTFHKQIHQLKDDLDFPLDMTFTEDEKSRFLSDCECFISAAQGIRREGFQKILNHRAKDDHADLFFSWRQLRHYLGRMQSYRQAADIIAEMSIDKPELFKNAEVTYINRAPKLLMNLPESTDVKEMFQKAFPGLDLSFYEADIEDLEQYGLSKYINEQLFERQMRTSVHGEVNLSNHLIQQGKTAASRFWNDKPFIATSKPLCRMCYFYFNSEENPFMVRSSHLNLYPKWRLPDVSEDQGTEAKEAAERMMLDTIEQMQEDTREILKSKQIDWRRNDSRTSTYGVSSRTEGSGRRYYYTESATGNGFVNGGGESGMSTEGAPPTPPRGENDEAWSDLGN